MPKEEVSDKIAKSSNDRKQQKKQQETTDRCKSQGEPRRLKKFLKKIKKDVDKKRQAVLV